MYGYLKLFDLVLALQIPLQISFIRSQIPQLKLYNNFAPVVDVIIEVTPKYKQRKIGKY